MATNGSTATEKLELHNLVALVKSARDKQKAGKPLTQKEIAAVAKLEERQTPAPSIDPLAVVRMVVALEPQVCDEGAIRGVLGGAATNSLADIASAFGVTHSTVKHTWRANGCPGDGKRRHFPLADILIWWLKRNESNQAARGVDEYTSRRRDAETRAAEAEARIKERKAEITEAEFVPLTAVRSVLKGMLNVVRDTMLNIPRQLTPMFPAKFASQWTDEADRLIRNGLTIIAEKPIDDFLERMEEDVSISN